MTKRLDYIDYAKGFSMLAIVLFHYLNRANLPFPLNKGIFYGGAGVHVFFFLSGLGLFLGSSHLSLVNFYKKRISKIYVPYAIGVSLIALTYFIQGIHVDLYALGGHIFFYKMFDNSIMQSFGGQMWFISTLFQLYFIFPFLLLIFEFVDSKWTFFGISLLISISWNIFIIITGKYEVRVWGSFAAQYIWEFSLGIIFGSHITKHRFNIDSMPIKFFVFIFTFSVALMCYLVFKVPYGKSINDYASFASFASLIVILYRFNIMKRFFIFIGKLSFEIYIFHLIIISLCNNYFGGMLNIYMIISLSLCVTIVFSYVYNLYITRNIFKRIAHAT